MLDELRADIDRVVFMDNISWLTALLTKRGIWALVQYRVSRWIHFKVNIIGIRQLLKFICAVWRLLIEMVTGVELPNRAVIGKGIFIPHAHGIILHCDAVLGDYCYVGQDVTIGLGGRGDKKGVPKIGDRVYIGPGAKIFGAITIGNDVAIGANAVVTHDLPNNAVAVGIPAKIINYNGSQDFIVYRDKLSNNSCSTQEQTASQINEDTK